MLSWEWELRTDHSTIIIVDLNTPLLIIEGITREKINNETENLNNIINQIIPKREKERILYIGKIYIIYINTY